MSLFRGPARRPSLRGRRSVDTPRRLNDVYLLIFGARTRPQDDPDPRTMYGFLLTLLVLDGIFLAVVILLQSGKGGGLAAMGGGAAATEGILGGRQATTMLTRASWIAGGVFMSLALVLSILSSRSQQPESIIRPDVAPATAPAPEPLLPGVEEPAGGAGGAAGEVPGDAGN